MFSVQTGGNLITGAWTLANFKKCGDETFSGTYIVRQPGYYNGVYKVDVSYMNFDGKGTRTEFGNMQPGGWYNYTSTYIGDRECWFQSWDRFGVEMIGVANIYGFDLLYPSTNTVGTGWK